MMKKLFAAFLAMFISISFTGCDLEGSSFSAGQRKAIDNSLKYISNPPFTSMSHIDTDTIKIENATENTWKSVWNESSQIKKDEIDLTDWVITIGDTSDHAFACIVCDSSTYKVIGFIPIE